MFSNLGANEMLTGRVQICFERAAPPILPELTT